MKNLGQLTIIFFILIPFMVSAQVSGGSGDGHANDRFIGLLSGESIEYLYNGGPSDGFAQNRVNSNLQGLELYQNFIGGAGDGHSTGSFVGVLNGKSTAMLFQAGSGDGFDQDRGGGIIRRVVIFPVELLSFYAFPHNDQVYLSWVTESELNNDFFMVERSIDGATFEPVSRVTGAGTTQQQQRYEAVDETPLLGLSYYRLKSTDFDGTFYYSEIVAVTITASQTWDMQVLSNPSSGKKLDLKLIVTTENMPIRIQLIDMLGRTLLVRKVSNTLGTSLHEIIFPERLASGSYLLRAGLGGDHISKLVVIQ